MKTFRAVMWNEMRVLWRRRTFWILQAVLLLPAVAVIVVSLFDSSVSQVFYGQGIPGLGLVPLLYLVMPILAGPSILRDLESTRGTALEQPSRSAGLSHRDIYRAVARTAAGDSAATGILANGGDLCAQLLHHFPPGHTPWVCTC